MRFRRHSHRVSTKKTTQHPDEGIERRNKRGKRRVRRREKRKKKSEKEQKEKKQKEAAAEDDDGKEEDGKDEKDQERDKEGEQGQQKKDKEMQKKKVKLKNGEEKTKKKTKNTLRFTEAMRVCTSLRPVPFLPNQPDIRFKDGNDDVGIKGHRLHDNFDGFLKLVGVDKRQRVQRVDERQREVAQGVVVVAARRLRTAETAAAGQRHEFVRRISVLHVRVVGVAEHPHRLITETTLFRGGNEGRGRGGGGRRGRGRSVYRDEEK